MLLCSLDACSLRVDLHWAKHHRAPSLGPCSWHMHEQRGCSDATMASDSGVWSTEHNLLESAEFNQTVGVLHFRQPATVRRVTRPTCLIPGVGTAMMPHATYNTTTSMARMRTESPTSHSPEVVCRSWKYFCYCLDNLQTTLTEFAKSSTQFQISSQRAKFITAITSADRWLEEGTHDTLGLSNVHIVDL